jgi:NO-binding membrane sensor protein with MHYT domain
MGHPGAALLCSYDYRRVVLFMLVPISATYVALDLAVCVTAARERKS